MTTNGATLRLIADSLRDAGLRRVNISLDTLDPEKFVRMTRRDNLAQVLDGIDAAIEAGFDPVKINTVVERGVNDDEILALAEFGRRTGVEVRFIEFMPLDATRRLGTLDRRRSGRDRRRHRRRVSRSSRSPPGARRRPIAGDTSTAAARSA